jgi:cytochrome P450
MHGVCVDAGGGEGCCFCNVECPRKSPPPTSFCPASCSRVARDVDVQGVQFLAEDMVLMPMGCAHYDPDLWGPRVGEFVPERWVSPARSGRASCRHRSCQCHRPHASHTRSRRASTPRHSTPLLFCLQLPDPPPELALPHNMAGAYYPFGGGLAACPGSRFAVSQMRAVLIRLVQTFSCLRLAPTAPPVRIFQKLVTTARDGIHVQGLLRR